MSAERSPTMILGDMERILIPAGEFTMGSDKGRDNEKPPHKVYLDAFYIGKYPITNAQYKRFVEATGREYPEHWLRAGGGSIRAGKEHNPVFFVMWYDVIAYCQWLSDETGRVVRLPTEAEWEKAARGTDGREYPWGNEFDASKCNNRENNLRITTPVGQYSPQGDSPYGVADMAGNVWEWTSSLFGKDYPYNHDDGREDLESEGSRVSRGGASFASPRVVRCAYRRWDSPDYPSQNIGFRVVVSPSSP